KRGWFQPVTKAPLPTEQGRSPSSAGVRACELGRRLAANTQNITGWDARLTRTRGRPALRFVTGPNRLNSHGQGRHHAGAPALALCPFPVPRRPIRTQLGTPTSRASG